MQYVWDPAKDVLNQRKHSLSLADGIPALEDPEREPGSMIGSTMKKYAP